MSSKRRSIAFKCTKNGCPSTWYEGGKEPGKFAREWKDICSNCQKKQRELEAKRNKVMEAEISLLQTKCKAQKEFVEKVIDFCKSLSPEACKCVGNNNVVEIIENLQLLTAPNMNPETLPKKDEEHHEKLLEYETKLAKIRMQQASFEANRDICFSKIELYKSLVDKLSKEEDLKTLIEKVQNLRMPEIPFVPETQSQNSASSLSETRTSTV